MSKKISIKDSIALVSGASILMLHSIQKVKALEKYMLEQENLKALQSLKKNTETV